MTKKDRQKQANKAKREAKASLNAPIKVKPQQGRFYKTEKELVHHKVSNKTIAGFDAILRLSTGINNPLFNIHAKKWSIGSSRMPDGQTMNLSKLRIEHKLVPERKEGKLKWEPKRKKYKQFGRE